MFGESVCPQSFLAELRHLAALLVHLAARPGGPQFVEWAADVHAEAARRTTRIHGPRWGVRAPESAVVRGHALAQAHNILRQPDVDTAAAALEPWLALIANEANGPSAWLVKRTTRTPAMERLIYASTLHRHHISRRLDRIAHLHPQLLPSAIPQLFDDDLYAQIFTGMLGGLRSRAQIYVSLCVARAVLAVDSWADAAARLGLDPAVAFRIARRPCLLVGPDVFAIAVQRAIEALPRDRDFRQLEARVRALAQNPERWHEAWRTSLSPPRWSRSLPFVITWMWCEIAQGCLDNSPAWAEPPPQPVRAKYRDFRARLPASAANSLRALVLTPTRGT